MKTTAVKWALLVVLVIVGCERPGAAPVSEAYEAEILAWRAERLENLKSPFGFLNLVGLYWLEKDAIRIGSAADNDIVFPANAAPYIGELHIGDEGVVLNVLDGVAVDDGERSVQSLLMSDDTTDSPVSVGHGSLAWTIIKRDDRFALRLRDFEHPAAKNFAPLDYYPIDPAYRVDATLVPFDEPKILNVNTTIAGLGYHPESPGKLAFELNGATHQLEAYKVGDRLFIIFGDQTSGRETYPAGRFVYTAWPDEEGRTILDFNKAYNPPCAFNAFATCPVASPRNRLPARIEVGETFDPSTHSVPEGYH
jgi:uncharacterized protein (DUF1684 family)